MEEQLGTQSWAHPWSTASELAPAKKSSTALEKSIYGSQPKTLYKIPPPKILLDTHLQSRSLSSVSLMNTLLKGSTVTLES